LRERDEVCDGDFGGSGRGIGGAENGEAKKAWVLLRLVEDGGGECRASGETSENEDAREEDALMRLRWERGDEVDEEAEMESSGSVESGDH
jgi:hypothetical protein